MLYRREIDGLRALAVIAIILFHTGFAAVSGGFVGVDIFFVISGYLITTILINDIEKGSFSLLNFYERRARRILPSLFFVMFITLPLAWFWMQPQDLKNFSETLVAVPLFLSNLLFYLKSGYFDAASELKPLLHTWSLAIEEQYYLLFPLFLMLTWKLGKNVIISLLLLVAIGSVLGAHWGSAKHPSFTFYLLPTRVFEILIGALISFFINQKQNIISFNHSIIQSFNQSVSLAGLALIFYAIFAFDKNTPYPSLYTLIPTIGTGLIIVFSNSNDLVGKLLGSKLLVGIGLISYSSYLWHHPLLAFARLRSINEPDIFLLGLLAILSIFFGYLSWKYIETPFKNKNSIPRNKIFIFSILASLLFLLIGFLGYLSNGFPARLNIPAGVSKSLIAEELKKENCGTNFNDKSFKGIELCSIGEVKKSNITLAIIGDSHVKAILPALDKIGKRKNERYIHMDKAGCPPFLNIDIIGNNVRDKSCRDLAIKQYNFITTHNIKNVLLISRWSMYTDGNYNNTGIYYLVSDEDYYPDKNTSRLNFKLSLKNTIKMYKQAGVNVFVLAQIPVQKFNASDVYNKIYLFKIKNKDHVISQLSVPKSQHLQLQSFSREVMNKLKDEIKFTIINLDDAFCDEKKCYIGNSKYSKYKDYDHLSSSGSLTISNALNYQLKLLESSPSP